MKLPLQSSPVLRYTTGNLTMLSNAATENQMVTFKRNPTVYSNVNNIYPSAWCIGARVQNGRVCISLPWPVGTRCISLPFSIPNFTLVRACISKCTSWGVPTGACVNLAGPGVSIRKCFGWGC